MDLHERSNLYREVSQTKSKSELEMNRRMMVVVSEMET